VRIKAGGAEVQVRATDVSPANPAGLTPPDNCMLIHLSEATLLENVRARYFAKEIYTLTGSILLAMNPFETLPIYSEAKMEPYKGKPLGKAPAHVYGTAESAYQMLSRTKQPQSIVVSGESGAGKTETNKHLMYYLAWRSKSGGGIETLAEAILQSNPVLEAFGNAKTARNNNSSRFGKFVKILIDPKGNIVGARMNQYLLEKSRVVTLGEGERNYHAFYHLVAGGSPDAEALGLGKGVRSFFYLNQSSVNTVGLNPNPNPKPGLNPKPYCQPSP
jgi:myosin heavy subunit